MRTRAYDLGRAVADGTAAPSAVAVLEALSQTRAQLQERTALRPEFRDELRQRLVAVATVRPAGTAAAPAPAARPTVGTARRRLALALAATGCAAAVGGLTLATDRSLPGEPLYAAKRATESLQMRTASNALERGERRLSLAETRLAEVRALAADADDVGLGGSRWSASGAGSTASGRTQQIEKTLADMDELTRLGSEDLRRAARDSGDAGVLVALMTWTDRQAVGLREVAVLLPSRVRERAEASLSVVAVVRRDADAVLAEVCGTGTAAAAGTDCSTPPGAGPGPQPPGATLTSGPGGEPGRPGRTPDGQRPEPPGQASPEPGRPGPTPSTSEPGRPQPTDPASPTPDVLPSSDPTPSESPSTRDPSPTTDEQEPDDQPTGEPTPTAGDGDTVEPDDQPDDQPEGPAVATAPPTASPAPSPSPTPTP